MFTGLVEEIGIVRELQTKAGSTDIYIACAKIPAGLQLGDSISVNGVCLTATWFDETAFSATATPETLKCSNLGALTQGSMVNLERSITLQTRLGGHMVQGHVDGTGTVTAITNEGDSQRWEIELSQELARQLIHKGSITVNGVSLTVASLAGNTFTVALIPKTLELTTFQYMKKGDLVNIEIDLIGKYVFRFMEAAQQPR
jgi:riboflavin synthase